MTRVFTHIADSPPAFQYERAGRALVTVFTPSETRRRITSPLKYNKDTNDVITYKAGRKPTFTFRLPDELLFQLRAELYPRFARFDAIQR